MYFNKFYVFYHDSGASHDEEGMLIVSPRTKGYRKTNEVNGYFPFHC